MAYDISPGARVTVWRPYANRRTLTVHDDQNDDVTVFDPDFTFQREAFAWQLSEDPWGGVADESARAELGERLMREFEPVLPPEERTFDKLEAYLQDLSIHVGAAEWSDSSQKTEDDGDTPVRINTLLSFYLQLRWIHGVFKDIPGASVSIR